MTAVESRYFLRTNGHPPWSRTNRLLPEGRLRGSIRAAWKRSARVFP